jgi:hypothetical protein
VLAGVLRVTELVSGAEITPENTRAFAMPVPALAHIISATVFFVVGAFQFVPGLRRGRRSWHRRAGLVLLPAGMVTALSGLWMTLFYVAPSPEGPALGVFRLVFGSAMLLFLVLSIRSLVIRDYVGHGSWVTRDYALGIAAGTQVLTALIWSLTIGPLETTSEALPLGAAWVINLGIAELVIARRRRIARAEREARLERNRARALARLS